MFILIYSYYAHSKGTYSTKIKKKVHELINITLTIDKSIYHSFAAPITLECKKGGIKFAFVLLKFRIFNCGVLKNVQSKGSYVVADYY